MIEHTNTDEVICPYCGYEFSDSIEFGEGQLHVDCDECGKRFVMNSEVTVTYSSWKAPCLNHEADHNWQESLGIPDHAGKFYYCTMCGKTKHEKNN